MASIYQAPPVPSFRIIVIGDSSGELKTFGNGSSATVEVAVDTRRKLGYTPIAWFAPDTGPINNDRERCIRCALAILAGDFIGERESAVRNFEDCCADKYDLNPAHVFSEAESRRKLNPPQAKPPQLPPEAHSVTPFDAAIAWAAVEALSKGNP
jgi:hypothetical protein